MLAATSWTGAQLSRQAQLTAAGSQTGNDSADRVAPRAARLRVHGGTPAAGPDSHVQPTGHRGACPAVMPTPRSDIIDPTVQQVIHCFSRCVRRAWLLDDDEDRRIRWLEQRLALLLQIFAFSCFGYAFLRNHLHNAMRSEPELLASWSDEEVARRWLRLYPKRPGPDGLPTDAQVASLIAQPRPSITEIRRRLGDLGWFHRCLKEPLARMANREDECTGHFWEGRYKSIPLLDDASILACILYVDLNRQRAGLDPSVDRGKHASIVQRLQQLREQIDWLGDEHFDDDEEDEGPGAGADARRRRPPRRRADGTHMGRRRRGTTRSPQLQIVLPIDRREVLPDGRRGLLPITELEYCILAVAMSRRLEHGRGAATAPAQAAALLESAGIDVDKLVEILRSGTKWHGGAAGDKAARMREALRRGRRWIVNVLDVHLAPG